MENKKNSTLRPIDASGRIVLPSEVRDALQWGDKTQVEIWVNTSENELIIRQHNVYCTYCGSTEKLKEFYKHYICPDCQKAISNL